MLAERQEIYEKYKEDRAALNAYKFKTEKEYKSEFKFLKEVDSIALQQARKHLLSAFRNFFRTPQVGYPKFKSKKARQSYSTINVNHNIKVDFQQRTIKLPKIKIPIKFRDGRHIADPIRSVTLSRTKTDKYYVSILIERDLAVKPKQRVLNEKIAAYDMSASHFLVSATEHWENQRFYRQAKKRLNRLHRRLSRTQPGSNNQRKARLALARLYEQIWNRKADWTHKVTLQLSRTYDVIILEDLNIKGMQQFNSGLAKSVTLYFSWHQFVTLLRYKCEWQGKYLITIDRFFPSSKLCSQCGYLNHELDLKNRYWQCPQCKTRHQRDQNAAQNIAVEGKRILTEELQIPIITHPTAGIAGSHAPGENVNLSFREQFSMNGESPSFMMG